jgi:hypothetical protein
MAVKRQGRKVGNAGEPCRPRTTDASAGKSGTTREAGGGTRPRGEKGPVAVPGKFPGNPAGCDPAVKH